MAKSQMVINYVPGEECRVAVVHEGKLNELHAERMDNVSHVGSIYVGRVVNVEASIQAAFIDFGLEHNGFLHVSDLHPQYFPGEGDSTTERVGKKTPRRDRPPIQECLRRGDEVAVQVLKEGVGTKGPTVTSYLSIPGRFLVMMPQMDRVGVSRKVEDEDTRRKMREILDQLDLPDGFGFILRTAGMDRGKMELKRDLAYLQRLWKDMEKRWKTGNKPRLLYNESDLLVRALRDILSTDIEEVVVDNPAALNRAARFLKIVAPRATTKLLHYTGKAPVFHVMGLEEQIRMIHAREVPLQSGGRLVIDETEALVAIDVNSGKSRDARDAETNAYRTNMEAADEICRQLRLRDLGGVIVNDLIDMRFMKHRREVENRFKDLLKKDRARWTTAPISEFGILEMTRQRMRGSHESQHFGDCHVCRGRGLVQRPDSVATEGLRELAAILDSDRVQRVEIAVSSRIAGELLSTKRRALSRIERESGKHVDVRVSDAVPVDRISFYAYDDRGADLDVTKLGARRARENELVEYILPRAAATDDWAAEPEGPEPEPMDDPAAEPTELEPHPIEMEHDDPGEGADMGSGAGGRVPSSDTDEAGGRRRRGRRRGRRGRGGAEPAAGAAPAEPAPAQRAPRGGRPPRAAPATAPVAAADAPHDGPDHPGPAGNGDGADLNGMPRRKRRRRRRGGRGRLDGAPIGTDGPSDGPGPDRAEGQDPNNTQFEPGDEGQLEVGSPGAEHPDDQARPQGPGSPDGPDGEGGQRRRRRRRRRGRGGAGGPGGMAAGAMPADADGPYTGDGPTNGDRAGAPTDRAHPAWSDAAHGVSDDEGGEGEGRGPDNDDRGDGPSSGPGADNAEGGPDGGPRRRRRRRRGRGGGAAQADGGATIAAGNDAPPAERPSRGRGGPPRESRPPQDSPPPRSGRREGGGRGSRGGGPPASAAKPPAPPPAKPKPRVLYSSRRKLGPGERRTGPGGDE